MTCICLCRTDGERCSPRAVYHRKRAHFGRIAERRACAVRLQVVQIVCTHASVAQR